MQENRICIDEVNKIMVSQMVPIELAQSVGLIVTPIDQPTYAAQTHSGRNLTLLQNQNSQIIPNIASPASSIGGTASPCSYYNTPGGATGGSSPIHQITKSLSGLTTGGGGGGAGGSITLGTPIPPKISSEPLDLSMDVADKEASTTKTTNWQVTSMFYDSNHQMSLSPVQQLRLVPTPPTSPNLCIIQEEMNASPATIHSMLHASEQPSTSSGVSMRLLFIVHVQEIIILSWCIQ